MKSYEIRQVKSAEMIAAGLRKPLWKIAPARFIKKLGMSLLPVKTIEN
jgi:hypothetical protein